MNDPLKTVISYKGRRMLQSTRWWLIHGSRPPHVMACIHDVMLDKPCDECEEQA